MNKNNGIGSVSMGAVVAALILAGCAHLPKAEVRYYLAQSKASFKVVRTVMCNKDNIVLIADAVTPTVSHSADLTADLKRPTVIPLGKLKGTFSDTDLKLEFYDDGRVKSFNGSNTGQGEAILKTVITIASAVLALDGKGAKPYPAECGKIKTIGDGKPISLVYEGAVDLGVSTDQIVKPDGVTKVLVDAYELSPAVGHVCAHVKKIVPAVVPSMYVPKKGDVLLWAREPARVQIEVTAGGENSCQHDSIWNDELAIAQLGEKYPLPIPLPTAFGKGALGASFAESGALTSVQFTSNTGAGQALNVLSSGLTATAGETTAQKAAALKAEADLIAQQQRLLQCKADPTTCKP